ncbi:hypothetical protein KM043_016444 [Ampulex compressa]|nr:hypothetical protein KM043_016444 [Ampulex compressa]
MEAGRKKSFKIKTGKQKNNQISAYIINEGTRVYVPGPAVCIPREGDGLGERVLTSIRRDGRSLSPDHPVRSTWSRESKDRELIALTPRLPWLRSRSWKAAWWPLGGRGVTVEAAGSRSYACPEQRIYNAGEKRRGREGGEKNTGWQRSVGRRGGISHRGGGLRLVKWPACCGEFIFLEIAGGIAELAAARGFDAGVSSPRDRCRHDEHFARRYTVKVILCGASAAA